MRQRKKKKGKEYTVLDEGKERCLCIHEQTQKCPVCECFWNNTVHALDFKWNSAIFKNLPNVYIVCFVNDSFCFTQ